MNETKIPLPGELFDGATVVASVWTDDDATPARAMALLLDPEPPFYRLVDISHAEDGWKVTDVIGVYPNIVPAVEAYTEDGGDY